MQKTELLQHPLSRAFPKMPDSDLFQLINDVRENGQREPIVIYDGQILDGWHRYMACQACGLEPKSYELPEDVDPVSWVLSRNLHRRHLEAGQRASAIILCREWKKDGRPQINRTPGVQFSAPATNKEMAEEAHVSTSTIKNAKAAHRAGLGEKVRDGELSAKKAAEIARPKEPALCVECRNAACTCPPPEEMVTITKERLDSLENLLSAATIENESMGKVIDADDHLKAAVEDRDTWRRKYEALEIRFNSQTSEFNECKKTVKRLQGTIKKLQAQIPKREREPGEEG